MIIIISSLSLDLRALDFVQISAKVKIYIYIYMVVISYLGGGLHSLNASNYNHDSFSLRIHNTYFNL